MSCQYGDMPHESINGYDFGQCTAYAAWVIRTYFGHPDFPNGLSGDFGNAWTWAAAARASGLEVSNTPVAGTIACLQANCDGADSYGHVAAVDSVSGGSIQVSDYNFNVGTGTLRYNCHTLSADCSAGIDFIHFGAPASPPPPTTNPSPPPPGQKTTTTTPGGSAAIPLLFLGGSAALTAYLLHRDTALRSTVHGWVNRAEEWGKKEEHRVESAFHKGKS